MTGNKVIIQDEHRCPEARRVADVNICGLDNKVCLLETGDTCDVYNDWLKEVHDALSLWDNE